MATWPNIDEYLSSIGFVVVAHEPGQTISGTHAGESYHYDPPGSAADYGTAAYSVATIWAMFDALAQFAYGPERIVEELAFMNRAIDTGRDVAPWTGHDNHMHVALVPGKLLPITAAPVKRKLFLEEAERG